MAPGVTVQLTCPWRLSLARILCGLAVLPCEAGIEALQGAGCHVLVACIVLSIVFKSQARAPPPDHEVASLRTESHFRSVSWFSLLLQVRTAKDCFCRPCW